MNTHKTIVATLLATLILSGTSWAHDPSMHKDTAEKPNCDAIKDMDHTELETDDPVMRAMMTKCQTQRVESEVLEKYPLSKSKTPYRRKIGHDAPMLDSAPPHESYEHRKVYEVADCENMSNMYHSSTDQYDPILQEMMKQCEKKPSATEPTDEPSDNQDDE